MMGSRARLVRRRLLIVLLVLCLGGAACLGYMGMAELMERRQGKAYYAQLAEKVHKEKALASELASEMPAVEAEPVKATASMVVPVTATAGKGAATSPAPSSTPEPAEPSQPSTADAAAPSRPSSAMDFAALRESCPNAVGWIRVEGGGIDHPIVQGEDNDFYLSHLPNGRANALGSIMMDQANDPAFGDMLTILHGHHMRSGAMFGSLTDYRQEAYYRRHPVIRLFTPLGDCDAEIFAACTVNGYSFGYPTSFEDEAAFNQFVRKAVSATPYETGVDVQFGDHILLLSTCSYEYSGARYIVMARLNWLDEAQA